MTAIRLSKNAIFNQLTEKGLTSAGVIYCRVVGNSPFADWLDVLNQSTQLNLARCADLALAHLQRDPDTHLIILCDLYVEGNEPLRGVEWDKEARKKGAIMGIMSHLLILIRNQPLKNLLLGNSERLVFAVIDEGKINLLPDDARYMLSFMKR